MTDAALPGQTPNAAARRPQETIVAITQAYRGGDANGRPGWWVSFSYDAEMVDRLKRAVPHTDRAWNSETKIWWVALDHEPALLRLLPDLRAYKLQGQLF